MHPADVLILAILQLPRDQAYNALAETVKADPWLITHPSVRWYVESRANDVIDWCVERKLYRDSRRNTGS